MLIVDASVQDLTIDPAQMLGPRHVSDVSVPLCLL